MGEGLPGETASLLGETAFVAWHLGKPVGGSPSDYSPPATTAETAEEFSMLPHDLLS